MEIIKTLKMNGKVKRTIPVKLNLIFSKVTSAPLTSISAVVAVSKSILGRLSSLPRPTIETPDLLITKAAAAVIVSV